MLLSSDPANPGLAGATQWPHQPTGREPSPICARSQYSKDKPVATGRSVRDTSSHIAGDAWSFHRGNGPPPFLLWAPSALDHPSGRSLPRPITRVETSRWHPGPPSARFLESGVPSGSELPAISKCPALSRVLTRFSQQRTANSRQPDGRSVLAVGCPLWSVGQCLPPCEYGDRAPTLTSAQSQPWPETVGRCKSAMRRRRRSSSKEGSLSHAGSPFLFSGPGHFKGGGVWK